MKKFRYRLLIAFLGRFFAGLALRGFDYLIRDQLG